MHFNLITFLGLSIGLAGCAISPDFGEPDTVRFKDRFGIELPTDPRYVLRQLGPNHYYLAVHQSSILISEREERMRFLKIAGDRVAEDQCNSANRKVAQRNFQQHGSSGWVSMVGEFKCVEQPTVAAAPEQSEKSPASRKGDSAGTGFYVNHDGMIVTNHHVVENCREIVVITQGEEKTARLRVRDKGLDLALLNTGNKPTLVPAIRDTRLDRLGETVVVAGFPLRGILSSNLNVTAGTISALTGVADNSRFLQVTAPVQTGNSGGPLLDEAGRVTGVVVSSLNAIGIARRSGSIPQNVNFAIKSSVLRGFLEVNGVDYVAAASAQPMPIVQVAAQAERYTVPVICRH